MLGPRCLLGNKWRSAAFALIDELRAICERTSQAHPGISIILKEDVQTIGKSVVRFSYVEISVGGQSVVPVNAGVAPVVSASPVIVAEVIGSNANGHKFCTACGTSLALN